MNHQPHRLSPFSNFVDNSNDNTSQTIIIPETNELYQPIFYPSTHKSRRDGSSLKPHADFYVDQVKQILLEGPTINREKSKTLDFSDPSSEGLWNRSHTFQFTHDDYLYIFIGAHAWHHYYRSIKDDCLFRISLSDIDHLYEGIDSVAVEEISTSGNAPIGGRIFPGVYFDEELLEVFMHGGLKQGRNLTNEVFSLNMKTLEWKQYEPINRSGSNIFPFLEGHTIIKRGKDEYYSYGGHGGNLIFTNSFYRMSRIGDNTMHFTNMKHENMIGYDQVTFPVAYHQAVYFKKHDVMIVIGGKMRSGENAPLSNDLLFYYFKSKTWMILETHVRPSRDPCPLLKDRKVPPNHLKILNRTPWIKTDKIRSHCAAQLSDSKLLYYGGTCHTRDHADDFPHEIFIFDIDELRWEVNESLSSYDSQVEYLVNTKFSKSLSEEACLEGMNNMFRGVHQNNSSTTLTNNNPYELNENEFDEAFVGRNYFSMNYDRKRNKVYIFGGSICSRTGRTRQWESSSLIVFHCNLRPSMFKLFPNTSKILQSTEQGGAFTDISIRTLSH
ncbi:hypothetical protein C9374_005146 [Naegleria lovaniensis]|uniref:Attractin/MKLN-like beta-propeller domain-containing protein n=1 Tax=Naegleria lovaniensis TaxID=51637 RepID=A0AA88KNH4_NAELO|nr:uncharacterized protein C9374_005146 [Naegleria lovaniensis]KAG2382566.1 hypothetical protein C9374_005146 [Naegleria lovaniensis]